MSPLEKFFASLKRLLEPRPPAESIGEPTADRPPPPEPSPSVEPASADVRPNVDGIAEVRAALEAVAEAPEAAPDPSEDAPVAAPYSDESSPVAATESFTEPLPDTASEPAFPQANTSPVPAATSEEAVDVTSAEPGRVGGALILTLATPAASFTVAKASATLGRGEENSIRLDDLSVSRRHARIVYRQGGYWISDLGSMGGTWVGGVKLNAPRKIAAGEVIDIGVCRLTVSFATDPTRAETKVTAEAKKSASRPRSEMAGQVRRRQ